MTTGRASLYYTRRTGRRRRRFPKISAVVDVSSHLVLGVLVDRGPKPDDIEFHRVARQAHARHPFKALLGDVGYDGEHHHVFLHQTLQVIGIIPPARGRPPKGPHHVPTGFYRRTLFEHWPADIYGRRWQIETGFSLLKRLLDDRLRAHTQHAMDREIVLRIITLNLMIIAGHLLLPLLLGLLNRAEQRKFPPPSSEISPVLEEE